MEQSIINEEPLHSAKVVELKGWLKECASKSMGKERLIYSKGLKST